MAQFFGNPGAQPPASERRVKRALGQLDDSWRVFHSVAWQSIRNGRQGDGEADFVLLHPRHGLVVLEVKGGRIEIQNGSWFSRDRDDILHAIKNPYDQARASQYALLGFLREFEPNLAHVRICYGIVLPDVSVPEPIGLFPRETLFDEDDLKSPTRACERLVTHWGNRDASILTPSQIGAIARRLSPTIVTRRRLNSDLDAAGEALIELTQRQIEVLGGLRRARRCLVRGGAGTGKTVLAIEKARQMAADGGRVLLTCFNAPLADQIKRECRGDPGVEVSTFHALCTGRARRLAVRVPTQPDDSWWDEEAATIVRRSAALEKPYDAIVVDEAQDFADGWISALLLLLRDPETSPIFAFADSHQQVYRRHWEPPDAWVQFELDQNCRNTVPIASLVAAIFDDPPPLRGAAGPSPRFSAADGQGERLELAQEIVDSLITNEGLAPARIVVLADNRSDTSRLCELMAGQHCFAPLGSNGVGVETIQRFKGLEADAVVLLLADESRQKAAERRDELLYVALSRARSLLHVVGAQAVARRLGLSSGARS